MPELALDDDERRSFTGQLDGMGVAELVRGEAAPRPPPRRSSARTAALDQGGHAWGGDGAELINGVRARSGPNAVAEEDHSAAEAALVDQLEVTPPAVRRTALAGSDQDRREEGWQASTRPAPKAWPASSGPATARSARAAALSARTASGSKRRSRRVLRVETAASLLE